MKSSGVIEFVTVISICVLLLVLETQYGTLSAVASLLTRALPSGQGHLLAAGIALWFGMGVYSFRRRRELSSEIAAHKKLQSEFEASAITDKMSGLPNRSGLEYYLNATARTLAGDQDLILIGVHFSNLKMIANVQGFEIANAIVADVVNQLVGRVAIPDFVAGVNGEQYYLLLQGKRDGLGTRAKALIDAILETMRVAELHDGPKLPLALHIGVSALSLCPAIGGSSVAAEMLRRCDLAVHEASQRGAGSAVFFDKTMESSIDRRGAIEASLDQAIRDGSIEPHFQPLIQLSDGSIAGFEILARWKHPTIGQIPPNVFIPIATDSGRLEELTLSILDRACRAAATWPGAFRIAVNISPKSLKNERFLHALVSVVKATNFAINRIEVEITEDAFVNDALLLANPISILKSEGISLAIDDFGTGYSSLRHLQILPFDKIKIDQSFVAKMMDSPESRKIVEAIIGLGRSMGLTTVAEGIEREDQNAALRQLGCKIGQGFLFAKAMPAEQAPEFIEAQARAARLAPGRDRLALAS
ncbi:MAG: GGDEF domain-containing protein [Bradyrhizobium sp.]|nr:MAG: GGDEF domain-containing protein [Bradyrhizobium sp.]